MLGKSLLPDLYCAKKLVVFPQTGGPNFPLSFMPFQLGSYLNLIKTLGVRYICEYKNLGVLVFAHFLTFAIPGFFHFSVLYF